MIYSTYVTWTQAKATYTEIIIIINEEGLSTEIHGNKNGKNSNTSNGKNIHVKGKVKACKS